MFSADMPERRAQGAPTHEAGRSSAPQGTAARGGVLSGSQIAQPTRSGMRQHVGSKGRRALSRRSSTFSWNARPPGADGRRCPGALALAGSPVLPPAARAPGGAARASGAAAAPSAATSARPSSAWPASVRPACSRSQDGARSSPRAKACTGRVGLGLCRTRTLQGPSWYARVACAICRPFCMAAPTLLRKCAPLSMRARYQQRGPHCHAPRLPAARPFAAYRTAGERTSAAPAASRCG